MSRLLNKIKLNLMTLGFMLGIVKEARVWTHNIYEPFPDVKMSKIVHSMKELLEYGRDINRPNRYINGKKIKYMKMLSGFNMNGEFVFIVLYKNAS